MSTITLTCTNCGEEFNKDKHEYSRRLAKLPDNLNFFCGRRCNAIYRNHKAGGNSNPTPPPIQPGNTHGQIYPLGTGWYVGRCSHDDREGKRLTENRIEFAQHLDDLWQQQNTLFAITGISLTQRDPKGGAATDNPFQIASIDRIDNSIGYEVGNVHWVSLAINRARGNTQLDEFKNYWLGTFMPFEKKL